MPQTGRGTTVSYSTTLTGTITYTPLATVISIDGPGVTVGETEATLLTSAFKPYVPTLPEGEFSMTIEHDGADPGVIAYRGFVKQAPVPVLAYKIAYQDGYVDTFLGFPKGYKIAGVENETRVTADLDVRLTTAITTTAPSGS